MRLIQADAFAPVLRLIRATIRHTNQVNTRYNSALSGMEYLGSDWEAT